MCLVKSDDGAIVRVPFEDAKSACGGVAIKLTSVQEALEEYMSKHASRGTIPSRVTVRPSVCKNM